MIHAESVRQWEAEVRDLKAAKAEAYRAGLAEGFARGTRAAADIVVDQLGYNSRDSWLADAIRALRLEEGK